MIQVRDLHYQYSTDRKIIFPDFTVQTGEHWLLLGESGSGKTTLLHLVGGLLSSQHGKIDVHGTDMGSLSESGRDRIRGKQFGFVFQKNHLINALTVEENLLMAPFLAGMPQDRDRAGQVLQRLGLYEKRNARVSELSHGQAQRVAIARAVLNKPRIILADEPTSSLDDKNCDMVIQLLLQMASDSGSTLLIATHDQRLKRNVGAQLILS